MIRLTFISSVFLFSESYASSIILHKKDAVVWHPEQVITGELSGFTAEKIMVHHGQIAFPVDVTNEQKFSFQIILRDKKNKIWVEVFKGDSLFVSDTLHHTLGYHPAPVVKPYATVTNQEATLRVRTIENPYKVPLNYPLKGCHRLPSSLAVIACGH